MIARSPQRPLLAASEVADPYSSLEPDCWPLRSYDSHRLLFSAERSILATIQEWGLS